jgi:hypothetical protein
VIYLFAKEARSERMRAAKAASAQVNKKIKKLIFVKLLTGF